MKLCKKCGRRPSERNERFRVVNGSKGAILSIEANICDDPIHDAADELVELAQRICEARGRLEKIATEQRGSIAHRQADDQAGCAEHELVQAARKLA